MLPLPLDAGSADGSVDRGSGAVPAALNANEAGTAMATKSMATTAKRTPTVSARRKHRSRITLPKVRRSVVRMGDKIYPSKLGVAIDLLLRQEQVPGNPAVSPKRSVALRPRLTAGLPDAHKGRFIHFSSIV
jgi:hypothetical protein